jgi:hypothetical protein
MYESVKAREIMRRVMVLVMLAVSSIALIGCGSTGNETTVGNANQNMSNTGSTTTSNTAAAAGSGPQNQGIGGNAPVNGNSRVEPRGVGQSGSINSNK